MPVFFSAILPNNYGMRQAFARLRAKVCAGGILMNLP